MSEAQKCPECGTELSGDSPGRMCVQCALRLAVDLSDKENRNSESTIRLEIPADNPGAKIGHYKLLQIIGEGGMGSVWMAEQEKPHRRVALKLIKLGMDIRGDLDWIVMKCLEKDRKRRYETANGLALDIQRHLHNETVVARPPSASYKLSRLIRRNKLTFVAISAVSLALVIGLSFSTWMFFKEKKARHRANVEANKSQQVSQFLKDMLKGVGPSVALGRDTTMLREILDQTAERAGKDLKSQPIVEAELLYTIGNTYLELAEYAKAEAMQREGLKLRKLAFGPTNVFVADSLSALGDAVRSVTNAEALHREALAMRKHLLGEEHPDVATSLHSIALDLYYRRKAGASLAESEQLHREALAIRRKIFGNEHQSTLESLNDLALVLASRGKPADAEAAHLEVLSTRRKLFGNNHPDVAESLNNLAVLLFQQKRYLEAETLEREALAIRKKVLGAEHPKVANSLNWLGNTIHYEGKFVEAEALQREALAIRKKFFGIESSPVVKTLLDLAWPVLYQGRLAEAETIYREALTSKDKLSAMEKILVDRENKTFEFYLADEKLKHSLASGVALTAGEMLEIVQHFRSAEDAKALKELAWELATSNEAGSRSGTNAVVLAERAVFLTKRTDHASLITLAASYAENGDFRNAIRVQKEAITLPHDEAINDKLYSRLKLYESKMPYRQLQIIGEKYTYKGGAFEKKKNGEWEESVDDYAVFHFYEIQRDAEMVFLNDATRNLIIQIPLKGGMSRLSTDNGTNWQELYEIRKASSK